MTNQSLGDLLKQQRIKKELTLCDLASKVGVSLQFVCDVESGRRAFPQCHLKSWSSALGIDPILIGAYILSQEKENLERRSGYAMRIRIVPDYPHQAQESPC